MKKSFYFCWHPICPFLICCLCLWCYSQKIIARPNFTRLSPCTFLWDFKIFFIFYRVELWREPSKSLGISIVGGRGMGSRLSNGEVMRGIFIKHVLEDSPAGKNGTLKPGDRIVEVPSTLLSVLKLLTWAILFTKGIIIFTLTQHSSKICLLLKNFFLISLFSSIIFIFSIWWQIIYIYWLVFGGITNCFKKCLCWDKLLSSVKKKADFLGNN